MTKVNMAICFLLKQEMKFFRNLFNRVMFCAKNTQILCSCCWLIKKFTSAINNGSKEISQAQNKLQSIEKS
ncbi:MAG: hypothetical protein CV082_10185 [Candidatus Brocadia sp. BL1]|nr:MAG: hypothetical protein CV082_10185 [Candidatus Brocadia sp. BL1]